MRNSKKVLVTGATGFIGANLARRGSYSSFQIFSPYGYFEDKSRLIPSVILNALKNKLIALSSPSNVKVAWYRKKKQTR